MKLRQVNEKARLPGINGETTETIAQKHGQIEVISVKNFLSNGAPDQHQQCSLGLLTGPQLRLAVVHGNSRWGGVKSVMEAVA